MNYNSVVSNVAAADLSGKEHLRVKLTSTGLAVAAGTDAAIGTLVRGGAAGKGVDVFLNAGFGLHYVKIGNTTAIAIGDELEAADDGEVVKRTTGVAIGQAWEAASADSNDGFIRALLYPKGGAPQAPVTAYAVDGAVLAGAGNAVLTKGSAGAYTLAAPAASQDGARLVITNGTAFAHVVTATDLLHDGVTGGAKDTATFGAFVGASLELMAYNQKWHVLSKNVVTIAAV